MLRDTCHQMGLAYSHFHWLNSNAGHPRVLLSLAFQCRFHCVLDGIQSCFATYGSYKQINKNTRIWIKWSLLSWCHLRIKTLPLYMKKFKYNFQANFQFYHICKNCNYSYLYDFTLMLHSLHFPHYEIIKKEVSSSYLLESWNIGDINEHYKFFIFLIGF